jgi:hypothetical protein
MPSSTRHRAAAVCALALVLSLSMVGSALAAGTEATLRVVGKGNKVLTEQTLGTGAISVKTSPKADCFGAGTGGSGAKVKVPGPTALGLLAQASLKTAALKPLLITDAFDFGLGICDVGQSKVTNKSTSWYLKVNHKGALVSGDAVKLKPGDEVLWDLATSFPYPNELSLVPPATTESGVAFTVHVFSYDEKGRKKPVAGATVTGASAPTKADGSTTVTVTAPAKLVATHGKDIPSAAVSVCAGPCPPQAS